MLMARAGLRVLLLDRTHPSRDTLSTHALMRAGVLQLDRWGLLDRIVAAGTPAGHRARPSTTATRAETRRSSPTPLYAPAADGARPVLLSAALEAGVEARFGVDVTELRRDRTGRVTGVLARVRGGDAVSVRGHR